MLFRGGAVVFWVGHISTARSEVMPVPARLRATFGAVDVWQMYWIIRVTLAVRITAFMSALWHALGTLVIL